MGTVSTGEIRTGEIKSGSEFTSITIGSAVFPSSTDAAARSVASFGSAEPHNFVPKSVYQSVLSSTASIDSTATIVGVNYNGPVVLHLPTSPGVNEVSVVDEGGFCSATNTITATSPGALGSLVLSKPYSHLRIRTRTTAGLSFVAEVREIPIYQ